MHQALFTRGKTRFITAVGVLLTSLYATAHSQELVAPATGATLTRCTPAAVTPGMWIKLEGYRMDGLAPKVKVLFVQDGNAYTGSPDSGSRESSADSQGYLESVSLAVPQGVHPGKCEIILETYGVSSAPLIVEITDSVSPAVISNHRPLVAQVGDLIWMTAVGIGESDEIEFIDSEGQVHLIAPRRTSEGTGAVFEVPDNLPGGVATFRVIERRSGLNQHSNSLSLGIDVELAPLAISLPMYNTNSLAPGQWVDVGVENEVLARRAELIEIGFIQNEQVIVPVQPSKPSESFRLHVQVPTSLLPGQVKVATRSWINGRASSWSEPLGLELLDHPAAPYLSEIHVATPKGAQQAVGFEPAVTKLITAGPGDTLFLSGLFMVESVSKLQITLEGPEQTFEVPINETGHQASVSFAIPRNARRGEWQIVVTNMDKAVSVTAPITLVIE
ncbi:MAG TPA: hypothetical protein VGV87_15575 [Blastocatellia bacterium]|nr:hypothetical protein [Blastocatellia bacterium]